MTVLYRNEQVRVSPEGFEILFNGAKFATLEEMEVYFIKIKFPKKSALAKILENYRE